MLITVGSFFFLNPMIALFDLIPDLIGCALIMFGLHRLSPLASDFENAFGYFKYMILASAARIAVALASSGFDGVTMLSVSLILGLVETGIAFAALGALCEGLSTLELKFDGAVNEQTDLKSIGVAFFAARSVSSMLPYVTSVLSDSDDLITGESYAGAEYSAILLLVNVAVTVVFAVFFVIAVTHSVGRLARRASLVSELHSAIDEKKLCDPDLFVRKNMTFALTLLAYSPLFLIDVIGGLPVGGKNFLPDFGFGLIVIWSVWLLSKQIGGSKPVLISGTVYTVLSAVSFFVYNDFLSRHYYTDFDLIILKFTGQYIVAVVFAALETAALIVLAVMLVKFLTPIATHYAIPDVPPEFIRLTEQNEKARARSLTFLKSTGAFLCFIAVMGLALVCCLQMFDVSYDDINFPFLLVHVALNIVFYATFSTAILRMKAGVLKRYERPSDVF